MMDVWIGTSRRGQVNQPVIAPLDDEARQLRASPSFVQARARMLNDDVAASGSSGIT